MENTLKVYAEDAKKYLKDLATCMGLELEKEAEKTRDIFAIDEVVVEHSYNSFDAQLNHYLKHASKLYTDRKLV